MPLIICEITIQLTCFKKSILAKSKITGTKFYVPGVTLLTQENIKLLK